MMKVVALFFIIGLLFPVTVMAENTNNEIHIDGYDTIIVGIFEIWKHSDGTWQDTDHDGKQDKPFDLDPRTISASLYASVPEGVSTQYDNVRMEIIPMSWEGDSTGENKALFEKDKDGYSAVIKEDMGLMINTTKYESFKLFVLNMRPERFKGVDIYSKDGSIEFILKANPAQLLKRTWQGQQVEGYGFYLPALVQYYGVPKLKDIEAVEIKTKNHILVNTYQVATAIFKNNGASKATFTAQYYAYGSKVNEEILDIKAGQTLERNFTCKSPNIAGNHNIKIYAVPLSDEKNINNNAKEVNVTVENYNYAKPDCEFTSQQTSSWIETYNWTVLHSETCFDEEEEEFDCSWTEYVSEDVPYNESLSAIVTINTKQGIKTDRNNPKESDRESRGSWDIIPWAYKKGLNPNEVTRAGYGFEVKVQTTYWTDWETKVPEPAIPTGGEYKGPTKVVAQFYNSSDHFEEQITLEPTKGKAGDKSITWELPLRTHVFLDGQKIYERKHYTDIRNKDGMYTVRIIIFDCGKEPLSICQDKYVTIYGDMYDDIYTRNAKRDEK